MSKAASFSPEDSLLKRYNTEISTYWQNGLFSSFQGKNNVRINFASFTHADNERCIVLVPGRSEGYLKYQELSYDLFKQGYDIHIIDHRGQGISERMLTNPYKGYVKDFDDYSDDLNQFINTVVNRQCSKIYLLSHSMGGAIAARYLQRFQHNITAAVFASPMIAVSSGGIPPWIAKSVVKVGSKLSQWFAEEPWYFVGQTNYQSWPFENNSLTQSAVRYQIFSDLYQSTALLQLGGVTYHWLNQAIKANINIFNDIDKLTTPSIVLQAGADRIVDNQEQDMFCKALSQAHLHSCPNGKPFTIEGARHELFFEQDQYRDEAIKQVLSWFRSY